MQRFSCRFLPTLVLGMALGIASPVAADVTFVAETPAAVPVSDAQRGVFRPGVMPALGIYTGASSLGLGLGLRLRGGVLRDGPAPGEHFADPRAGGLLAASIAVRALVGGAWIELAAGAGATGYDFAPVAEIGLGWGFDVGAVTIGPSARYVSVVSRDTMDSLGSAALVLAGVDVRWGRSRPRPRITVAMAVPAARSRVAVEPLAPAVSDGDRIVEQLASCREDLDGCPLAEHVRFERDRIVLDERVLFDLDRARVRRGGRATIAMLARLWQAHPEWQRITIEGHADVRGTDEYNRQLSERRARRVRAEFLRLGVAADRIDAVGFGRSRPRVDATSESGHARNRRVEFVIERAAAPTPAIVTGGAP